MGEFDIIPLDTGAKASDFLIRLLQDVRALEQMLEEGKIEAEPQRIGAEQEVVLVDRFMQAAPVNLEVIERASESHLTVEIGRFNLEFNLDPLRLGGNCFHQLEQNLNRLLADLRTVTRELGVEVLLIGVLPTIRLSDLSLDQITPWARYRALNKQLTALHGGQYRFYIQGEDDLILEHNSIMMEACTTSFQTHLQVAPEDFAAYYNAAQAITGPVLAVSTNAPLAFGKRLWHETRIALFQQSVDTRRGNLYLRNMSPRVTFGTSWVRESILEIIYEDVGRFQPLLGSRSDEHPLEKLAEGKLPYLHAYQAFHSTIYRWNRPCYGITNGKAHLRIENRTLPSGPSTVDEVANTALWMGLIKGLTAAGVDVANRMAFRKARASFRHAARLGLEAHVHWLDGATAAADELMLAELLPIAREGLSGADVDGEDIDHYLGVIEERVKKRRSGSYWIMDALTQLEEERPPTGRVNALISTVSALLDWQQTDQPVHEWDLPTPNDTIKKWAGFMRVEQCMSTDMYTVADYEPVAFVVSVMNWQNISYLPVEDDHQRITGLVTVQDLVKVILEKESPRGLAERSIREVMTKDPVTVVPETFTWEALQLMRTRSISCLPVVNEGKHVVGILTASDVMDLAAELM